MKLLLDEQISGRVADLLRRDGRDITAVADDARLRGLPDPAIFAYAQRQKRAIVTYDRGDFERLAREHEGYEGGHHGLVVVRSARISEKDIARLAKSLAALLDGPELGGSFQVWLQPAE